jgi:hypothetical protein
VLGHIPQLSSRDHELGTGHNGKTSAVNLKLKSPAHLVGSHEAAPLRF